MDSHGCINQERENFHISHVRNCESLGERAGKMFGLCERPWSFCLSNQESMMTLLSNIKDSENK